MPIGNGIGKYGIGIVGIAQLGGGIGFGSPKPLVGGPDIKGIGNADETFMT